MKQWKSITIVLLILAISRPFGLLAAERTYPKLANYFLKWTIEDYEVSELAKWDLLIFDMEVMKNSRKNVEKIRKLNPDIKLLAYITAQEVIADIYQNEYSYNASERKKLVDNISDSWWLRDGSGNRITFWPGTYMLNLSADCKFSLGGEKWNEYLPWFVKNEIYDSGLFDGVFYDNLWGDVSWANGGKNIDINGDGKVETVTAVNKSWAIGTKTMLSNSREIMGDDFIIIGNGMTYDGYQPLLNGMMFESFPSPWENGGTWSGSMTSYKKIAVSNMEPKVTVLNTYSTDRHAYAKVRFGLASALLEDTGYFSYDYDNTNHGQLWWYDEYDVNLGDPLFPAVNLLDRTNTTYKAGLWRRDFENGIVMLNSTKIAQKYVFSREEFEKINGTQDKVQNDGSIINWIKLNPNDAIILLKRNTTIINNSFYNGSFVRVYDINAVQVRNGFFSYLDNFPGGAQILAMDVDSDQKVEYVSCTQGLVSVYKGGKRILNFTPFVSKTNSSISLAVANWQNKGKYEIITGSGKGSKPQIKRYSIDGKLINSFSVYSPLFLGGVNVAVSTSSQAVIVGPGAGGTPEVRIYDINGKLIKSFLAYDTKFKGGVNVAIGDVNEDGKDEIITGAGAGGGPEVRVFDMNGKLLKKFYAYDKTVKTGVKVMAEDINSDGKLEILASTISF
jgi:hypothetical protein